MENAHNKLYANFQPEANAWDRDFPFTAPVDQYTEPETVQVYGVAVEVQTPNGPILIGIVDGMLAAFTSETGPYSLNWGAYIGDTGATIRFWNPTTNQFEK